MQKKRSGRRRELFILGFNLPILSVVTYATKCQLLTELVTRFLPLRISKASFVGSARLDFMFQM